MKSTAFEVPTVFKGHFSKEKIKEMGADAISSNVFCALMAVIPELLLAGMDVQEYTRSRIGNILPNTFSGVVYGKWRSFVIEKLEKSQEWIALGEILQDGIISGSFSIAYLPIYFSILNMAEVEHEKIMVAMIASVINSSITGPLLGIVMDEVRKKIPH
ncbi:MAG: L-alanine exporter AlaE [Candidatus Peregrinibacteria bacterium]